MNLTVTDHAIVREFAAIPGASVLHLHHNKHELTFLRPGKPAGAEVSEGSVVETMGIEPTTYGLQSRRSAN